MTGNETAA